MKVINNNLLKLTIIACIFLSLILFSAGCLSEQNFSGNSTGDTGKMNDSAEKEQTTATPERQNRELPGYNGVCSVPKGLTGVNKIIATGRSSSFALRTDGTVIAWGINTNGMCNGAQNLSEIVEIEIKNNYGFALKSDGTVVAWGDPGDNSPPELEGIIDLAAGNNDNNIALTKEGTIIGWGHKFDYYYKIPENLSNVIAIDAGSLSCLALKNDGTVVEWNKAYTPNKYQENSTPIPEDLNEVKAIASGDYHSLALKDDGTVVVWGNNEFGQCNVPEGLGDVIKISAQNDYSTALKKDGILVVWGKIFCPYDEIPDDAVAISEGDKYCLALRKDGTVVAFGSDICKYADEIFSNITSISAGDMHKIALKSDGTIITWGDNYCGQCSIPEFIDNVKAISTYALNSYVLLDNDTITGWGQDYNRWDNSGELFGPYPVTRYRLNGSTLLEAGGHMFSIEDGSGTMVRITGWNKIEIKNNLKDIKMISPGPFLPALKNDGTVISLAGDDPGAGIPENLTGVVALSGSGAHNLALKSDGTVVAWGDNSNGQCNVPEGLTDVIRVDAGIRTSLALKRDGTVTAWGNLQPKLYNIPKNLGDVIEISAGNGDFLALKSDGTIVEWGFRSIIPDSVEPLNTSDETETSIRNTEINNFSSENTEKDVTVDTETVTESGTPASCPVYGNIAVTREMAEALARNLGMSGNITDSGPYYTGGSENEGSFYFIVYKDGSSIFFQDFDGEEKGIVSSNAEAAAIADEFLADNSFIAPDAARTGINNNGAETLDQDGNKYQIWTTCVITYSRKIDGQIVGSSHMQLEVNAEGDVVMIFKNWAPFVV